MCKNCHKVKCKGCNKPQTYPHIESVELSIDPVNSTLTTFVNGVKSNAVPYYTGGGGGSTTIVQTSVINVLSDGQTFFGNALPLNAYLISLSVNGIVYDLGDDYIISGADSRDIIWQSGKFPLKQGFYVVIEYIVNAVTT